MFSRHPYVGGVWVTAAEPFDFFRMSVRRWPSSRELRGTSVDNVLHWNGTAHPFSLGIIEHFHHYIPPYLTLLLVVRSSLPTVTLTGSRWKPVFGPHLALAT